MLNKFFNRFSNTKITAEEIIGGTNKANLKEELNYLETIDDMQLFTNLNNLCLYANYIRERYDKPMIITCGFRNPEHNKRIGGSKVSLHMQGLACDFADPNGRLDKWFLDNIDILSQKQCAIEHPFYTKNWCHFQIILPKSKKNVFIPYSHEPNKQDTDLIFKQYL